MDKLKLTFLGTGSAIPTDRRNHPAMLLQYKEQNILVDCGEGTQRQFRKANINPCKLTRILITHWHADHTLGIAGLLQTLMLNGYNKELEIYGPKGTSEKVKQYFDLFIHKGEKIKLKVKEVSTGKVIETKDYVIESHITYHDTPSVAYSFTIKEKSRLDKQKLKKLKIPNSPLIAELAKGKTVTINGKKIDGKKLIYSEQQKKITFILDTRMNSELIKFAASSDILVTESTYASEEKELAQEHSHLTVTDATQIAKQSKSKKLFLIHLSQKYDKIPKLILEQAKKVFKESFVPEDLTGINI